jgi:hypothetical protein
MALAGDKFHRLRDQALATFELGKVATENDAALVSSQRQAKEQKRLAAASLPAVIEFVSRRQPG